MTRANSPAGPTIGIVVALPVEARTLGMRLVCNELVDLDGQASVFVCGAGPENARRAVEALLACDVAGLVSWGTAGGLAPDIAAGTGVAAHSVIRSDAAYETCPQWSERIATGVSMPLRRGALYSTGELVTTAQRKSRLHAETGALAVDAESGMVAELACAAGVPFVCVRAVIDDATMQLPAFAVDGLDESGFPAPARMLAALARNPADVAALPGLARSFLRARRTLSTIRREAGPRLFGL